MSSIGSPFALETRRNTSRGLAGAHAEQPGRLAVRSFGPDRLPRLVGTHVVRLGQLRVERLGQVELEQAGSPARVVPAAFDGEGYAVGVAQPHEVVCGGALGQAEGVRGGGGWDLGGRGDHLGRRGQPRRRMSSVNDIR